MINKRLLKSFRSIYRLQEVVKCFMTTPQWLPMTLAYLNFKELFYPFEFSTRSGTKIILNTVHDLITVWIIFFRKEYLVSRNCKSVIDAGANIGTFSLYASQLGVDKIYAIEPFPSTFEMLKANIQLNNLDSKIKLFRIALSGKDGSRNMDLSPGPSQSRGLLDASDPEGLSVPALTLESFISQTGLKKIDLLKIDIEGGEYDVFENCEDRTLEMIDQIVMEYHPKGNKNTLFQKLINHGFNLSKEIKFNSHSGVAHFVKTKRYKI